MTLHVVFFKSYGEWRCTMPFPTIQAATDHIRFQLARPDKDYITHIQMKHIEVDETP